MTARSTGRSCCRRRRWRRCARYRGRCDDHNGDSDDGLYYAYRPGEQLTGITPGCGDDLFGDVRPRDGHAGEAYPVCSGMWLDRAAGTGVVFAAIAGAEAAPAAAESAVTAVAHALATGTNRPR